MESEQGRGARSGMEGTAKTPMQLGPGTDEGDKCPASASKGPHSKEAAPRSSTACFAPKEGEF